MRIFLQPISQDVNRRNRNVKLYSRSVRGESADQNPISRGYAMHAPRLSTLERLQLPQWNRRSGSAERRVSHSGGINRVCPIDGSGEETCRNSAASANACAPDRRADVQSNPDSSAANAFAPNCDAVSLQLGSLCHRRHNPRWPRDEAWERIRENLALEEYRQLFLVEPL